MTRAVAGQLHPDARFHQTALNDRLLAFTTQRFFQLMAGSPILTDIWVDTNQACRFLAALANLQAQNTRRLQFEHQLQAARQSASIPNATTPTPCPSSIGDLPSSLPGPLSTDDPQTSPLSLHLSAPSQPSPDISSHSRTPAEAYGRPRTLPATSPPASPAHPRPKHRVVNLFMRPPRTPPPPLRQKGPKTASGRPILA